MTADGMKETWPADIVHVNEDGWVLVNRGSQHGVAVGLRLLVVGQGVRVLRDLFAATAEGEEQPVVLRTRRTYELLEVVYVEETCAVAVAARAPFERRPSFYRSPTGELLVWVPLPADYTWQPPEAADDDHSDHAPNALGTSYDAAASDDDGSGTGEDGETFADQPPEHAEQEDDLWEQALPLNSVSVGDLVVLALPATPSPSATSASPTASVGGTSAAPSTTTTPYEQGRTYDWMKTGE